MYWDDKPYYSLNYYLKEVYSEKVYKLALNGGMTCPNRDGLIDTRGCIFCSSGGSGEFTPPPTLPIKEQLSYAKDLLKNKHTGNNIYINVLQGLYCTVKSGSGISPSYKRSTVFICGLES